jgi:ankyrin repeat protein
MNPAMSNRPVRPRSLLLGLTRFLPALLCFAAAVFTADPLTLILLLAGDALMLTAICAGIGFDMDLRFARSIARRGLAGFILFSTYSVVLAVLMVGPAWWLLREPTLGGALALSAALLLGLLALWRSWPAIVLPFVWDDAYPAEGRGSWLMTALRRSFAFAHHLTGENELFFSHGLPSALAMLVLCGGALALAALGGGLGVELRVSVLVLYALVLAPLATLTMATRCVSAMFADARERRAAREREVEVEASVADTVTPDHAVADPDATLLAAARSGQIDLALAALELGASPDTAPSPSDRDQRSVLIHAVILPDLRLLRALIAKGVDVNRSHAGMAPLLAATRDSYQGRPDAIMTLLANGADCAVSDADGNTALHHAALCGEPIVAALLLDAGVETNAVNREGMTALGIACANGNWALATFLLDRGAACEVEGAQPALLLAASLAEDDPTGVRLLLKRKAKVDARGLFDRSALMAAALAGHATTAELLLAAGARVDLLDRNGTNALMEAARAGSVAIIHALGRHKVDPDRVDSSGRTALMIACGARAASEEVVSALLAIGADRDISAVDGRRAIDHAVAGGRWPIVALLDPGFALPSNLQSEPQVAGSENCSHLLDALRFGHWNVADEMRDTVLQQPPAHWAQVYLGLQEPEQDAARAWVCNLGLPAEVDLDDGRSLGDVLLAGLPSSSHALLDLVRRGHPIGGAGLLARVLASAPVHGEHRAIVELARVLLERGADCFGRAAGDLTPLHLASALGDAGLVETLLLRGSDPNARDARGRMPLHHALKAASADALGVVRLLIRHGADPEAASASGETALGLALARADRELVYWLNWPRWRLPRRALRGADLPAAAVAGDIDAVDKLLLLGFPVGSVDAQGATALIRAAGSGYAALVVRLLDVGADPAQGSYSGATCLSAAVAARREAVVRTLLQHGVDAGQRLPGGGTPLMIAAALGLPRLAEPLLEQGADANAADDRGNTALQAAAQFAFDNRDTPLAEELMRMLLAHGASIRARNQAGQDALLLLLGARAEPGTACDAQHIGHLATLLLDKGAVVDNRDQRGVSALHACAMHGLLGVARLLRAHGASIEQRDALGRTPGEIAALLGYVDVAAELGVARSPMPGARQTLRKRVD